MKDKDYLYKTPDRAEFRVKENRRTAYEYHVRGATRKKLTEAIEIVQDMTLAELEYVLSEEGAGDTPALFLSVAAAYVRSIRAGDFAMIDKIYDRVIGKSIFMRAESPDAPSIRNLPVKKFIEGIKVVNREDEYC